MSAHGFSGYSVNAAKTDLKSEGIITYERSGFDDGKWNIVLAKDEEADLIKEANDYFESVVQSND